MDTMSPSLKNGRDDHWTTRDKKGGKKIMLNLRAISRINGKLKKKNARDLLRMMIKSLSGFGMQLSTKLD